MGHFTAERLAPLSGIGFALLLIITRVLVFTYPDSDAPTSEAVSFWTSKDDKLIAVSIVGSFAALFFVWFGGSVREVIRAAEGGTGRLAALSFGGAVITAGVILVEEFLVFAAAESAGGVPDQVTQTISALQADFFLPIIVGFALFFFATGLGVLRTHALSGWVGWTAIVLAVLWILPNPVVPLLTVIWTAAVGVLLFLRAGDSAPLQVQQV